MTFLDKAGHYFDCVELMVGWLTSQGLAESVIQSVLALQAQFERLQAEPEQVQQLQSKVQESQPVRKEAEQLPQAKIQVTPPTQSLALAPRLIKLQAPRLLETLQPMTISSSMETQSKSKMSKEESETLKTVTATLETESSRTSGENQRTFASLPGWQRHGPKGLVCSYSTFLSNVFCFQWSAQYLYTR